MYDGSFQHSIPPSFPLSIDSLSLYIYLFILFAFLNTKSEASYHHIINYIVQLKIRKEEEDHEANILFSSSWPAGQRGWELECSTRQLGVAIAKKRLSLEERRISNGQASVLLLKLNHVRFQLLTEKKTHLKIEPQIE